MGTSCSNLDNSAPKPDENLPLPQTESELNASTKRLAVPAPILYRTRQYRFAGRSRGGFSGTDTPNINQDSFLYYNVQRLDIHMFMVLDGSGPDGDLAVSRLATCWVSVFCMIFCFLMLRGLFRLCLTSTELWLFVHVVLSYAKAFFVKEKLLFNFARILVADQVAIMEQLPKIFKKVDELLAEQDDIDVVTSGVTVIMVILDEDGAIIANCGDCRAILGFRPPKSRHLRQEVRGRLSNEMHI